MTERWSYQAFTGMCEGLLTLAWGWSYLSRHLQNPVCLDCDLWEPFPFVNSILFKVIDTAPSTLQYWPGASTGFDRNLLVTNNRVKLLPFFNSLWARGLEWCFRNLLPPLFLIKHCFSDSIISEFFNFFFKRLFGIAVSGRKGCVYLREEHFLNYCRTLCVLGTDVSKPIFFTRS